MIDADFAFIRDLVHQRAGIMVGADKRYLIETRMAPLLRRYALVNLEAIVRGIKQGDKALEDAVVDAMTTNETLFFRDRTPFDHLEKVILPALIDRRRRVGRIRIWCAACSTGQEPYSIAMMLEDMRAQLGRMQVDIIATDLSDRVLEQAAAGRFSHFEVQRGLPVRHLVKYFTQEGTRWILSPGIVEKVKFQKLNLIHDFSRLGQFDLILCRNVLIYFDQPTKRMVLERLARQLSPDGFLLLGGAETVLGLTDRLMPHRTERTIYVSPTSPDAPDQDQRRVLVRLVAANA